MNIEFLSTVAVIAPDPARSRKLYVDAIGLPLHGHAGDEALAAFERVAGRGPRARSYSRLSPTSPRARP